MYKILLIEDDKEISELVSDYFLRRNEVEVSCADNGEDGDSGENGENDETGEGKISPPVIVEEDSKSKLFCDISTFPESQNVEPLFKNPSYYYSHYYLQNLVLPPENKTNLYFCTHRNETMFLKEERKYNPTKEKPRDFLGSKWPETMVSSF